MEKVESSVVFGATSYSRPYLVLELVSSVRKKLPEYYYSRIEKYMFEFYRTQI